jgi:lipase
VARVRPSYSSTAGWEAPASGSRSSRSGRRAIGSSRSTPTADQAYAVAEHVGAPVCLVGFSWGGATALRVAAGAPELVDSLALIEPEAYALLRTQDVDAYAQICDLRDRWRAHVGAGRWCDAFEEFIDFYNGPGSFARWAPPRREAFLAVQRARGDLWDALFDDDLLTLDALATVTAPVHVIEGSQTSAVDHAICTVVRQHVPDVRHTVIAGAGHMMPLTHPEPLTRALLSGIGQAVRLDSLRGSSGAGCAGDGLDLAARADRPARST